MVWFPGLASFDMLAAMLLSRIFPLIAPFRMRLFVATFQSVTINNHNFNVFGFLLAQEHKLLMCQNFIYM